MPQDNIPLVSVVVPVFNGARYLKESLDSILAQTYRPLEVLVMDDASTDATPEILASYGHRIRAHRQDTNKGIYDNTDDGIHMARGDLIAVYHADDVYLPAMVERQVAWMAAHPGAGAVFTSDLWIDAEGRQYGRLHLPPEVSGGRPLDFSTVFNALLSRKNTFLVCPTAMVRAEVYRELGGYRQHMFRNSSDLDMWIRIAARWPLGVLEEPLMRYRHFHGSSSGGYHHLRTEPERFFVIMDHHLERGAGAVARPGPLADYEAHRAEDALMIAASHYIKGERGGMGAALGRVRAGTLLRSRRVQRGRLLLLLAILQVLARLPRIPWVAHLFDRRWHRHKRPGA